MKKNKFSNHFKEIKFNEKLIAVDDKHKDFIDIIEEAILDDDTPEWKRKLARAVNKELHFESDEDKKGDR